MKTNWIRFVLCNHKNRLQNWNETNANQGKENNDAIENELVSLYWTIWIDIAHLNSHWFPLRSSYKSIYFSMYHCTSKNISFYYRALYLFSPSFSPNWINNFHNIIYSWYIDFIGSLCQSEPTLSDCNNKQQERLRGCFIYIKISYIYMAAIVHCVYTKYGRDHHSKNIEWKA